MYELIDEYSFKAKNLYNYANYTIRQEYITNQKFISYPYSSKLLKTSEAFKEMGSNSAQMTLRLLNQNWKSFFESLSDYKKNPSKYFGRPSIPQYLKKDGRHIFIMTNVQSKVIDGYLQFSFKPFKPFNNKIRTKINGKHMQTRFVPKGDHYVLEIVYETEVREYREATKRVVGIDLGISRFATIQNNFGSKPFCINGGEIKAINNYYNKKMGKCRRVAKKVNKMDWTSRQQKLTSKRHFKIENFLHNASKYITDYCKALDIDTVIVGYNPKWKQKSKIGKATQQFVSIPFEGFVSKLEYKLKDAGIKLIKTEESYTSKASFIDGDKLEKGNFSGSRIQRGLYKAKKGTLINADVNGASNIIKKVFPNAFADGIKDVHFHPTIMNVI